MQLQDARGRSNQTRRCTGRVVRAGDIGATSSACEPTPVRPLDHSRGASSAPSRAAAARQEFDAQQITGTTMDEAQRNKQLVLDAYSGRPGALMAALAPTFELHADGKHAPLCAHFRGRTTWHTSLPKWAPCCRGRMTRSTQCRGTRSWWSSRGRRTKDGRDYNNRYCSVFHIADGRITRIREYLDTT